MNCYVLVGGRSSRMGQSKAALFFDRILAAARPVFDEVVAVDRAGGVPMADVRTIFEEPHADEAPIFGVARALQDVGRASARHMEGGLKPALHACFILAVDYPRITAGVLRFLRDRAGVPVWQGKPQPLCAVWDAALLPRVEQRIAEGRFDLRGLPETAMIDEAELRRRFGGEPLMNVNTPEELEAAENG